MESEVYEVELEFDRESETKIRVNKVMQYRLHYKSPRPERHERSQRKLCSLLLPAALVGNLNGSLRMNTTLTLREQFYSAQKMPRLNQISRTY